MDLKSFFRPKPEQPEQKMTVDNKPADGYVHIGSAWKKLFAKGLASLAHLSAGGERAQKKKKVRKEAAEGRVTTRIAPSPTGPLHIGTARSALFNYLFAKQHDGIFFVRIEDTDRKRSKKEYEDDILQGLAWLNLEYDRLFRQSERAEIYAKYLAQLLKEDTAYLSKEQSADNPEQATEVIRLRNKNTTVSFSDMVRGAISFDTTELGDFVIARSATDPLYHFAVVVDDYEMGVTHVIRGEDHISNTPRQILVQEALGFPRPHYAHLPLILNPDRTKMSKRGEGSTVAEYRREGYHPEAVVNYLALLGWNPGTERETFTLPELINAFDIAKIGRSPAIFNADKLGWFNRQFLRTIPRGKIARTVERALPEKLRHSAESSRRVKRMVPMLQEKIKTTADIARMVSEGELDYFFLRPSVEASGLSFKGEVPQEDVAKHLTATMQFVRHIPAKSFTASAIKHAVWDYATKEGRGAVLWPMRYALSGKERSPDAFTIAEVLGKKETLARIDAAINLLEI